MKATSNRWWPSSRAWVWYTAAMMDNLDTGHAGAGLSNDAGLAVDEAAAHAGVSDRTIRRALKARGGHPGHLPSWRVKGPRGSEYRISLAALDEWMGRRDALDSDTDNAGDNGQASTLDSQARLARGASLASLASLADTSVQSAAVQAIVEQLVAPLVDHLDRTQRELGVVREELGRERHRAEVAEQEATELHRIQEVARAQAAELGHERALREAAEREADELRRARRQMPWWLRLILGGR